MRCKPIALLLAAACVTMSLAGLAGAATLIDSPFITGYDGWTDVNTSQVTVAGALPHWGVLINNDALAELSDGAEANGGTYDPGVAGDGLYKPWLIVNPTPAYATPSQ